MGTETGEKGWIFENLCLDLPFLTLHLPLLSIDTILPQYLCVNFSCLYLCSNVDQLFVFSLHQYWPTKEFNNSKHWLWMRQKESEEKNSLWKINRKIYNESKWERWLTDNDDHLYVDSVHNQSNQKLAKGREIKRLICFSKRVDFWCLCFLLFVLHTQGVEQREGVRRGVRTS